MPWKSLAKRTALSFVAVWFLMASFSLRGRAASNGDSAWSAGIGRASNHFVIADFDGDQKPDFATVIVDRSNIQATDYSIHFRLSEGLDSAIGITARGGGLQLISRDVNGDDVLDVVVRTSLDSSLVAVLVNDGHGKFTKVAPESFPELEKEPEFYLGTDRRPVVERVLLPPRTSFGEEVNRTTGAGLQAVSERLSAEENQRFCTFLFESSSGRSPPELI